MIYGYARCSTNKDNQDINRQIQLKAAGAEEVIFEYEHSNAKVKQNLLMLLETVQEGYTVIPMEISRLSRSTKQLCEIIEVIREKHLRLVIVSSTTIDCRYGELDCMSATFLQMAVVFSELQIIRARVKSEMANAKAKGKKAARPQTTKDGIPTMFFRYYPTYTAGKMNVSELARVCGLSRSTVYKYLRMIK